LILIIKNIPFLLRN
jgi:hypothetical protein